MTDAEKLALFSYIQDHEASEGVIARRLLWANEAEEALQWILKIAAANYEQDVCLRSQGARTLKRIVDKARTALNHTASEVVSPSGACSWTWRDASRSAPAVEERT